MANELVAAKRSYIAAQDANEPVTVEGSYLTNKGLRLIRKLLKGGLELHVTQTMSGDGELADYDNPEEFLDLVHPLNEAAITGITATGDGEAVIGIQITSIGAERGYFVREVGIWAEDPDEGEILYAYVSLHDHPLWIRPEKHTVNTVDFFYVAVVVDRVEQITATISVNGLVTIPDLEAHNRDPDAHPDLAGPRHNLVRIEHNLGCYPLLMAGRLQYGLGMGGLGEGPLGGTEMEQIAARARWHDRNSLTVKTTKAIVDLGPPVLHQLGPTTYTVTFEGNDEDSLMIELITPGLSVPVPAGLLDQLPDIKRIGGIR